MCEDKSDTDTGVKDSGNYEVNGQCSNTLLLPAKYYLWLWKADMAAYFQSRKIHFLLIQS